MPQKTAKNLQPLKTLGIIHGTGFKSVRQSSVQQVEQGITIHVLS